MFNKDLNVNIYIILIVIIIVLTVVLIFSLFKPETQVYLKQDNKISDTLDSTVTETEEIVREQSITALNFVPTNQYNIGLNDIWSGSFNIAWDNFINVAFVNDSLATTKNTSQLLKEVTKFNFASSNITDNNIYTYAGNGVPEAKDKIVSDLTKKLKVDDPSLNNISLNDKNSYIMYSYLSKHLSFKNEFTKLGNGKFGDFENVTYYGVDKDTKNNVKTQVEILYKDVEKEAYAICLKTAQKDNVYFVKNVEGKNLKNVYENLNVLKNEYTGSKTLEAKDTVKVPNIKFKECMEYPEFNGIKVYGRTNIQTISNVIETVDFELDSSNSKVTTKQSKIDTEGFKYNFDSECYVFVIEDGKTTPYLALHVNNIELFQ